MPFKKIEYGAIAAYATEIPTAEDPTKWQPCLETDDDVVRFLNEEPYTRDQAIACMDEAINEYRAQREAAGVVWNGYTFQTDSQSLLRITAENTAAQSGVRANGELWFAKNNMAVALTNAQFQEMAAAVRDHIRHCFAIAQTHKHQVRQQLTIDAVLAYNYKQGWDAPASVSIGGLL